MSVTLWDRSAYIYSREVERIRFYQATNQALVTAGKIQPGMILVDLACGTGFTIRSILDAVGKSTTIYGVDQSCEMLALAQRTITTETVQFIHASAEDFASHIPELVDRAFCNAAFFLFRNIDAVLGEIRTILKPMGLFAFNLPDQEYDFGDGKPSEMEQVVNKYLGPFPSVAASPLEQYSADTIHTLAATYGFRVVEFKVIGLHLSVDDLIRFYSIPYIGTRRFPNRTPEELKELVTFRFQRCSDAETPYYRWAQFVFSPESHRKIWFQSLNCE